MRRSSQSSFLKSTSDKFGGLDALGRERTTRISRGFRPVSVKSSMHLILKSSRARGSWSFLNNNRKQAISKIINQVAKKYGVVLLSGANVGNHIHIHLRVHRRWQYIRFIRVVTARIAFLVTGANKLKSPLRDDSGRKIGFWTQRPITRVVHGWKDFLKLSDYIRINKLEGLGWPRSRAEFFIRNAYWNSSA